MFIVLRINLGIYKSSNLQVVDEFYVWTSYKLQNERKRLVGWGDVDWIGLAKDRNRWRALVNSVLNLRVA
jgi:hypothetical protein